MKNLSREQEAAQLRKELAILTQRLDTGLPQIQDALSGGRPVPNAEARWVALLREYERTYDALQELGGG